ncbi:hypothetical protein [Paenarthrobacter histidinolovorans]|uniref:Uncharacterized protein n=1 Tax=Paenarthrobacter histidinolovorans TaxID=43664 RepID=A0ABW8MZJ7_9MICC
MSEIETNGRPGLKARLLALPVKKRVLFGVMALCLSGAAVVTGADLALSGLGADVKDPVAASAAMPSDAVPATATPAAATATPTTSEVPVTASPTPIDSAPVAGPASGQPDTQVPDAPAAGLPESTPAAPAAQVPAPVPAAQAPAQAAPAPAPAEPVPAPAPVIVPAAPAPAPAPAAPVGRTEGLNQSLASINAHRAANGKPAFVTPGPACRLVATAVGTALDAYQHQDVVLAVWGKATGATFSKGLDFDTLNVFQCL